MKRVYILFLFLLFSSSLLSGEDLDELLQVYKKESDLSKITKKESAGNLTLYTRDQLEKMQARNLVDVLKTVPGIFVYRGVNNLTLFSPQTMAAFPTTAARLYINDHDMTSTSFGSAFLIWGEMPIEYIDHIEVYKTSSSIEFGNESGLLIIKVYTKKPLHDLGSKVRAMADQKGSYDLNIYNTATFENGFSYFAYANVDNNKREPYYNYTDSGRYTFKSDSDSYNLYADLRYKSTKLEIGNIHKRSDSFIGIGFNATPTGGEFDADHFYTHFTQLFDHDVKLELAYDKVGYNRSYIDPNGIYIIKSKAMTTVENYNIKFEDEIYSAVLEKRIRFDKHSILAGAFYKYKEVEQKGRYDTFTTSRSKNGLNLFSLYGEERYDFDPQTRFILMAKGDFYRYDKEVDSANELILRGEIIKKINDFHLKLFYTDTYLPNSFFLLYNSTGIPYTPNPHLKHAQTTIGSGSVEYTQKVWDIKLFFAHHILKDTLTYGGGGKYVNSDKKLKYNWLELNGHYRFDPFNTLFLSFSTAQNGDNEAKSPKYAATMRLEDTLGRFDLYNELLYTSSFTDSEYGVYVGSTLDWTLAGKYHFSKDFSVGIRGENILDKSYSVLYRHYLTPIPSYDRKLWINLEYLF